MTDAIGMVDKLPQSERLYKALHERHAIQRYASRRIFRLFELLGFHLVGDHFYEPIPNSRMISAKYTNSPRTLTSVDFRFDEAERYLVDIIERWGSTFRESVTRHDYVEKNPYFYGADSLALYCHVRNSKPSRVTEVGQGISTKVLFAALEDNRAEGAPCEFTTIDPYQRLDGMDTPSSARIITKELQELTQEELDSLVSSDFLFVDSSHVHKFGSDVEFQFERIYPNLRPGTTVHIHDIFSPYHYPLDWFLRDRRFWNEAYHLENFLQFNHSFEVLLPLHLVLRQSARAGDAVGSTHFPNSKFWGSSFYIKRVA